MRQGGTEGRRSLPVCVRTHSLNRRRALAHHRCKPKDGESESEKPACANNGVLPAPFFLTYTHQVFSVASGFGVEFTREMNYALLMHAISAGFPR